jgi:CRISPR-associated exonuclease Cas4
MVRGLAIRSSRLGLVGKTDVAEFRVTRGGAVTSPFPLEYKRGRPKRHDADRVQLCAQALCLEEMLGVPVPGGALFYGRPRRREEVEFDGPLRERTEEAVQRLRSLIGSGRTPKQGRKRAHVQQLLAPSDVPSRGAAPIVGGSILCPRGERGAGRTLSTAS